MNTLSPQSKWAADRCTLHELKQAEFHFKTSAQLGFLVASWHALDFMMYLPSSEDNMRLFLFFFPSCTMISSKKILTGGFLERWELASADSRTLSYQVIISGYLWFWLQTKRTLSVSALLWLFWLYTYFLFDKLLWILDGFHMNSVVLNWIC